MQNPHDLTSISFAYKHSWVDHFLNESIMLQLLSYVSGDSLERQYRLSHASILNAFDLGTGFDGPRELAISGPAMDRLTTDLNAYWFNKMFLYLEKNEIDLTIENMFPWYNRTRYPSPKEIALQDLATWQSLCGNR